jgi:hypothetical protein
MKLIKNKTSRIITESKGMWELLKTEEEER